MTDDKLFEEIKAQNHFRVVIRPTVYESRRIPNLSACWDLMQDSVNRRAHFSPEIDRGARVIGPDWIQSGYERDSEHKQVWRLFQSGMLVSYFLIWEDFHEVPWISGGFKPTGRPSKYLEWKTLLYRITDIFEFSAKLAEKNILSPGAYISIELTGLKDRVITSWDTSMDFHERDMFQRDVLQYETRCSQTDLLASADDLAAQATYFFYEQTGWMHPDPELLKTWQVRHRRYDQ